MDIYDINDSTFTPNCLRILIDNLLKDNRLTNDKIHKINIDYNFILKLFTIIKLSLSKYDYNYEYSLKNCINPSVKSKHSYFLEQCASYAKNSDLGHKHGCVIVYNYKIISWGFNTTNKSLKDYSIHAEIDALNRLNKKYKNKKIMNKVSLYVVRIRNNMNGLNEEDYLKMSKPCMHCASKIKKIGIKTVYYSVDDNYVNDFIYEQIVKFNKCK